MPPLLPWPRARDVTQGWQIPRAYRSRRLRNARREMQPRLSWRSGLLQLLLGLLPDYWQDSEEARQAELVEAQSEPLALGWACSLPPGSGTARRFGRRTACPAGQCLPGLLALAQAAPRPRETPPSHYDEGTVWPRAASHTAPPQGSPGLAGFLGFRPLGFLGFRLLAFLRPLPG